MKRKLAELINIIFGFRKFLLMLFLMLIAIIFRVKDYLNGAEMVDLLKTTAIAFMGANGVEHLVSAYTGKGKPPAVPEVADTDESNDEEDVK